MRNTSLIATGLLLLLALTRVAGAKPFLPGETRRHYGRHRTIDLQHLRLALTFHPSQRRIAGTAALRMRVLAARLRRISLDAAELSVARITANGRPITFVIDAQRLHLRLPRVARRGETLTIVVHYSATPRIGLFFVLPDRHHPKRSPFIFSKGEPQQNHYWFPTIDYPNERFTSETLFSVPKSLTVITNGKLVSTRPAGSNLVYHHRMAHSHVSYLLSVVVGRFHLYRQRWRKIPVLNYVPLELREQAPRAFRHTPQMLTFFSKVTGFDYPYSKYAQVAVPAFVSGGMEHITATTLTADTLHDKRAHIDFRSDGLVAHELAHQWFGDLITCKDWSHVWLNESFATYFDLLFQQHKWGDDEFHYNRGQYLQRYFREAQRYTRPIVTRRYSTPYDLFDAHAYPKGAAVLHMVRAILGERTWQRAIATYVRKHAHQVVETSDFRKALEQASGRDWSQFFDQWLYRAGHPRLRVKWRYDLQHKRVRLTVTQHQSEAAYTLPASVVLSWGKRRQTRRVVITKKTQHVVIRSATKPTLVEFDPSDALLKTIAVDKAIPELLEQLKRGSHLLSRVRAAKHLEKHTSQKSVLAALTAVLRDRSAFYGLRVAAVKALIARPSTATCTELRRGLDARHPKVRRAAVIALGQCAQIAPAGQLKRLFDHDPSYWVRRAALGALVSLRSAEVEKLLKEALNTTSQWGMIAAEALEGIATLRLKEMLPLVAQRFSTRYPRYVRGVALRSYAKLVNALGLETEPRHRLAIEAHLDDVDLRVRFSAIRALGILGNPGSLPALLRIAQFSPSPREQRRAREAIRRIKAGDTRKSLEARLRNRIEHIKKRQRDLLGESDRLHQLHFDQL